MKYYNELSVKELDILHRLLGYVYVVSDGKIVGVKEERR